MRFSSSKVKYRISFHFSIWGTALVSLARLSGSLSYASLLIVLFILRLSKDVYLLQFLTVQLILQGKGIFHLVLKALDSESPNECERILKEMRLLTRFEQQERKPE